MRSGGGDRSTLENGREIKSPWKKWKNLKWPQEDRKTTIGAQIAGQGGWWVASGRYKVVKKLKSCNQR